MRLNLRARAHPRIGVCTEAGVHLLATMWEAKAMIDSARTDGTTLRGEQQLPPHRLQDSGLQASAMRHVVPTDNAAENPRPQRGVALWSPASEAFFQRSRYRWFRLKPQRHLSPPERLISWSMLGLTDGTVLVPHPPKRLAGRVTP